MMNVSLTLKGVADHLKEIQNLSPVQVSYQDSRLKIRAALKQNESPLIYFYCHGGRNKEDTWLGVGNKEEIVPTDLIAWGINWPIEHPFVFISCCLTVDISPDDLIHFHKMFARCEAAGLMGTEITIPESLARYFAKDFFSFFFKGEKVGETVRKQRLTMLKNFNLLGLAYTPYCHSELHINFS